MAAGVASQILDRLWETAEELVTGGVTRSHDLTGIVFQRLIADRKFLATFYTRPASAALLAGLALPADKAPGGADWGDADTLAAMQIGDFACGTGTLLSAAYQRVSLLHELHGGDPEALHAPMMEYGLAGLDVLNSAVHLTATMLASTHPRVPFGGECLLVMPYGGREHGIAIGSLDLLAAHVEPGLIHQAVATTAGGRSPSEVTDLVNRVGHGQFDVVIMNPPFSRPTNHEGVHESIPIPSFAAFDTSREEQKQMSAQLSNLSGDTGLGHGNAGLASYFVDLAVRKLNDRGVLAIVLPLSAASGTSWAAVRSKIEEMADQMIVVSVSGAGSYDAAFSADTGIAEILLIVHRKISSARSVQPRSLFVSLRSRPDTIDVADATMRVLTDLIYHKYINRLNAEMSGGTPVRVGDDIIGEIIDASDTNGRQWYPVGILDGTLAQLAHQMSVGSIAQSSSRFGLLSHLGMSTIGEQAEIGPVHRDITGKNPDGSPRGPFDRIMPPASTVPTYPMLSSHTAKLERQLTIQIDSEGRVRTSEGRTEEMMLRAEEIWGTATRAHYNADLQFNSQSIIMAMTKNAAIGGTAWPSIILTDSQQEYLLSLWCNSSLGLLCHWWVANKSQSGRGRLSVTGIPHVPALNLDAITPAQHATAKRVFEELSFERFLPFDQIDEDPARAELDRRLLVEVLGLPEELCEPGGAMELLRRKLAAEPQIHGGKKTRIIFEDLDEPDPKTGFMWRERTEKRDDR